MANVCPAVKRVEGKGRDEGIEGCGRVDGQVAEVLEEVVLSAAGRDQTTEDPVVEQRSLQLIPAANAA
jgi:hypothetical protein